MHKNVVRILSIVLLVLLTSSCREIKKSYKKVNHLVIDTAAFQTKVIPPFKGDKNEAPESLISIIGKKYGTKLRKNRNKNMGNIVDGVANDSAESLGNQGQSLLLMMLLTGIDLIDQAIVENGDSGKHLNPNELLEYSNQAAEYIMSNLEIWTSLIEDGIVLGLSTKPLEIFIEFLNEANTRGFLQNVLSHGIANLYKFLGEGLAGELYMEARELLEDESDYQRAEKLSTLLASSIKSGLDLSSHEKSEDWRIIKKITGFALVILFHDNELRNLWLYNAFRKNIATGEFVIFASSTIAGTMIFPGAGTIAGMMFGVAVGALTYFIPDKYKDSITSVLQNMREKFWKLGIDSQYSFSFMNYRKTVIRIAYEKISQDQAMPSMLDYNDNSATLDKVMTIYFERFMQLESVLQITRAVLTEARKNGNQHKIQENEKILADMMERYLSNLADLQKVYAKEILYIDDIFVEFPIDQYFDKQVYLTKYPLLLKIKEHNLKIRKIQNFIKNVFIKTVKTEITYPDERKSYFSAMQRFYLFGFTEKLLLEHL